VEAIQLEGSFVTDTHCSLNFNGVDGCVSLGERIENKDDEFYGVDRLLDEVGRDDLSLHIDFPPLEYENSSELLGVGISVFHVDNKETGRAFHLRLEVLLDANQVESLFEFVRMRRNLLKKNHRESA
jgi:hypothetical protein